ncbi:hypothetical protein Q4Q34_17335 [Flavivirga abyssicola]|uniref:acyltransferase n=1 Tax=Flavivirga abyssicola TaxID=3063533 RepID=UPI0026E09320|nr:hypothetical protein [Flavivirga sp. MEBiC07777]WVK12979.1 hypothetical protein Q4Q34_17335 [Flavivirga sp. MEBiC07777]
MIRLLNIIKKTTLFLLISFNKSICNIRSYHYTRKINNGGGKIIITEPFLKFSLRKQKASNLFVKGTLRITSHIGGNSKTVISLGSNSILKVNGDFSIGDGVRVMLNANSSLTIGGKNKESDSGITCNTLIMVNKKISIGEDFICAWGNFISDSDWHSIDGQNHQKDVIIGDHIWIANNCNILKGTIIGDNTIIASNTKIVNKTFPGDSLIAGIPPKIIKQGVNWSRDI